MDAQLNDAMTTDEDSRSQTAQASPKGREEMDKFPEPRAWALRWDASNPADLADRQNSRSAPDQDLLADSEMNGKFPQPHGWALRWDGLSITALQEFYNPDVPPASSSELDLSCE